MQCRANSLYLTHDRDLISPLFANIIGTPHAAVRLVRLNVDIFRFQQAEKGHAAVKVPVVYLLFNLEMTVVALEVSRPSPQQSAHVRPAPHRPAPGEGHKHHR